MRYKEIFLIEIQKLFSFGRLDSHKIFFIIFFPFEKFLSSFDDNFTFFVKVSVSIMTLLYVFGLIENIFFHSFFLLKILLTIIYLSMVLFLLVCFKFPSLVMDHDNSSILAFYFFCLSILGFYFYPFLQKQVFFLLSKLQKTYKYINIRSQVITEILKNRPHMWKYILGACIYPGIWGFYFSLSRFIRIGETYDVSKYLSFFNLELFFLFLCALPNLLVWFKILFDFFRQLREFLWNLVPGPLHYYHLIFLQYDIYFYLVEKIYKLHFFLFDLFISSISAIFYDRKKAPAFFRFTSFLYYKSWIFAICFLISILFEIIISHGFIHYSIYTIFFYPFVFGCLRCFHAFGVSDFVNDVCMSDYVYKRYLYSNVHYYTPFFIRFNNTELYYGFSDILPRKEPYISLFSLSEKIREKEKNSKNKYGKLYYRTHGIKIGSSFLKDIKRIGPARGICIRLTAGYFDQTRTRWFSTTRILLNPLGEKLHVLTPIFIKTNPFQILAYMDHPSCNFNLLQQVAKKTIFATSECLYKNNLRPNIVLSPVTNLISTLENNTVMRFHSLMDGGVIVGVYNKLKPVFAHPREAMQGRPDVLLQWVQSRYAFQGYFGIDQKKGVSKKDQSIIQGRNQALVLTQEEYEQLLNVFKKNLSAKVKLTEIQKLVLRELNITSATFELHLQVWAENLHLFPETWRPPLRLEKNFDLSQITPEVLALIKQGVLDVKHISDKLFELKVLEETACLSHEALDILNDSQMQWILGNDSFP